MRMGESRLMMRVTRMAEMEGEKAQVSQDSRVLWPAMMVCWCGVVEQGALNRQVVKSTCSGDDVG